MKTVIIDNYDSFTYNLSHLVKEIGAEVTVLRNDQFLLDDLQAQAYPVRQGCCSTSSVSMQASSPSWESASAIRPSARCLEPGSRTSATCFMA